MRLLAQEPTEMFRVLIWRSSVKSVTAGKVGGRLVVPLNHGADRQLLEQVAGVIQKWRVDESPDSPWVLIGGRTAALARTKIDIQVRTSGGRWPEKT